MTTPRPFADGFPALRRLAMPVLVLVMSLAAHRGASAQNASWTAGYTLGLTSTSFDGALGDSIPESQFGFGLGVFMTWPIVPHLRFQPELLLSVRGGTFNQPWSRIDSVIVYPDTIPTEVVTYGEDRRTVDLTYLELPLLLCFSPLNPSSNFQPHLTVGGSGAFRVLGRYRGSSYTGVEPVNPDDANRWDMSWIAGIGADVRTRRAQLRFDLRYTQGVVDVFDFPAGRNRAWTLVFGIHP